MSKPKEVQEFSQDMVELGKKAFIAGLAPKPEPEPEEPKPDYQPPPEPERRSLGKPKKYLLFAGHYHYPQGGTDDLFATADSVQILKRFFLEKAELIAGDSYIDNWGEIVQYNNMQAVWVGSYEFMEHRENAKPILKWAKIGKDGKRPDLDFVKNLA